MKAHLVWRPDGVERSETQTVFVGPAELSSLREALKLPPEVLRESVAMIRTYVNGRVVGRLTYRLRLVESITPFAAQKKKQDSTL